MKNKSSGFTLIELLVVISIIGLLSSIVVSSLNGARTKARAARRKADISQLKKAFELYLSNNVTYPIFGSAGFGNPLSVLSPQLVPNYMSTLPVDPKTGISYAWGWGPNAFEYSLYIPLEGEPACKSQTPNTYTTWWGPGIPLCNF